MKNTMNIFAETLALGGTIYSKSAAKITGDKVGAENFANWKTAMQTAHQAFYTYKKDCNDLVKGYKVDTEPARQKAWDALCAILDMVGDINGHALTRDNVLLNEVVGYAVREKTLLMGNALFQDSVVKNLKHELTNTNGATKEWLEAKTKELETAQEQLRLVKKTANSGKAVDERASFNTFCANFERKLAKLASDQSMKTWEELEAEEAARKEEKKARKKAKKAAAKAAQAQ